MKYNRVDYHRWLEVCLVFHVENQMCQWIKKFLLEIFIFFATPFFFCSETLFD